MQPMHTAVWTADYQGRPQALTVAHNPHGVTVASGARAVQLVFFATIVATIVIYTNRFHREQH